MKFVMKFLAFSLLVMATHLINADNGEFEDISVSGPKELIIEQTSKADQDIDWQFELINKDDLPISLKVSQDNEVIVPDQLPSGSLVENGYLVLNPGKVIRIAGLKPSVFNDDFFTVEILYKKANKKTETITAGYSLLNKTIYLEFKNKELSPVKKGWFIRATDSGLSLEENIQ